MRNVPGPVLGASLAGQPFLTESLGPDARIAVEIAWGADPSGNADLWSWTDITGVVYQTPGITFKYGRSDEAAETQSALGSMILDNSDAAFSLGGISPNWPNVKLNVPVRVRIDPNGTGFQTAFQGNAVDFTPSWDTTGSIATVRLEVAGTIRRLLQGGDPKISAPRRYYTQAVNWTPLAYYPLDEGSGVSSGKPAIGSGAATLDPAYLFSSGDSTVKYFGQGKLAYWLPEGIQLNKLAVLRCEVPKTPILTDWWVTDLLVSYAEGDLETGLFETVSSVEGDNATWGVRFLPFDKQITAIGYVAGAGPVDLATSAHDTLYDGNVHHVRIWVDQSGADVNVVVYVDDAVAVFGTQAGQTLHHPDRMIIFASSNTKRYFGHLAWWNNISWAPFGNLAWYYAGTGASGEDAITRIIRVCAENGIPLNVMDPPASVADTAAMGPQPIAGTVALLRECAAADQGVLFDGLSSGLTYVARNGRENGAADLVIDAGAEELFVPFQPKFNDARRVNKVKAKRSFGGEYVYEDTDGPLGTFSIGVYDGDVEVNIDSDDNIDDFASWAVHLGTVEGYRYPTVALTLEGNPHLATQVLALRPGSRIDVINVDQAFPTHSEGTVNLLVEGIAMTITPYKWRVTLQCSSFDPWRIITLAAPTGDTTDTICHLDTSESHLGLSVDLGATSLSVETTTGPVWTQTADDFPFEIAVGGVKAVVTNVTGSASPQTFTIDPLTRSRPSQSPVEVWIPPSPRL